METIVCHRYPITGLEHILINSGARVRIVVLGFEKLLEQTRVNTGSRSAVNRAVSDLHWSSRELVGVYRAESHGFCARVSVSGGLISEILEPNRLRYKRIKVLAPTESLATNLICTENHFDCACKSGDISRWKVCTF